MKVSQNKILSKKEIKSLKISKFLKCCLAMDPNKRWSCEQLLEHTYFDNYLIETKREDNKSKSYQAQNMFQNDRKSKQPGVSRIIFSCDFLGILKTRIPTAIKRIYVKNATGI